MEEFLKYKSVYNTDQEENIAAEFKRTKDSCYLDHAGASLYSEKQMQLILFNLSDNIYANPHSLHLSSKLTEDHIDIIRFRILQHFNITNDDYSFVFTSGATQSLKIVAETFNYGQKDDGTLVYLENNHTSVLGMRNYTKNSKELKTVDAFTNLTKKIISPNTDCCSYNNLFVYPAQCNFSGTKYPLKWIDNVKKGALNTIVDTKSVNWFVLLDAASFLACDTIDLSLYKPDFVTISFYKIFGYPTGLGGLLVKKDSENVLRKKYYGGGTIEMVLSERNLFVPRRNVSERFEDGTLPFLSIISLTHGFDTIKRLKLTFNSISKHTFSLAQYVYRHISTLHHFNGQPVATLYHDTTFENLTHQGAIVNFNLLRANGDFVGYSEVLHIANLRGIHLRTGCHCNPGGCQRFLKLSCNDVIRNFKSGHVCGDQTDLIDGYPTGTIRISFGYMSTKKDADKFITFIEDCFVDKPILRKFPSDFKRRQQNYSKLFYGEEFSEEQPEIKKNSSIEKQNGNQENYPKNVDTEGILEQIIIYPLKSCGAFVISDNWIVTKKGFKFDREWMIVNAAGVSLTQKHNKKMCLIKPSINLKQNRLRLSYTDKPDMELDIDAAKNESNAYLCHSKVCGDRVIGWDCGDEVSDWLSENLDIPGLRLLRQYEAEDEECRNQLSFANQAQYLLTNSSSVEWLRNQVPDGDLTEDLHTTILRFRPNIVVKLEKPFEENEIDNITISDVCFKFAGKCTRCQMICIDQTTGNISKEPLLTLSKNFKGKINFGVYLNQDSNVERIIQVGCKIFIQKSING
ncbi:molybdenum cofactor sulfurase 3 isoform X1 [Diorhabda carinulata]|uniref:molybdenum cofactor sulfurase 3 isoform X1 n=2 Tax=Diorhabda carinulata TaxID=1163345 RepID=UPI0025A1CBD4|nr:molybdenum cofactor sulfurase 3 isoform X1 [Diorhabda carinulata]